MAAEIQAKKSGSIETADLYTGKTVARFYAPVKTAGIDLPE
jgi:hypothetical protein